MSFENFFSSWKELTLDDIAIKDGYGLVDGPFGSNLPASEYATSGIPVIRGSNLSLGEERFKDNDFVFVSEGMVKRLERSLCYPLDIIFTKKGTLGQTGIIPQSSKYKKYLLSSNQMKLSVNKDVADPLFVYYYVSSDASREKIIQDSEATGVPKTNLEYLRKFPIALPPLPAQRAIARILGSLDDKIEANRRMNETLEAMARAVFKSWFVDFDPVRARAEGREPAGMDAETAALFPDGFEETEMGMVPRGWNVGSFDETIELIGGGTPKTSVAEYWNGSIPWFSIVDAPDDSDVFVIDTEKRITKRGILESSTRLLLKGTTIITARGTVGKCAFVGTPMAMNQSCYGIHGKDGRGDYFTYFALRNLVNELRQSTHGSVFDTITRDTFQSVRSAIVPLELTQAFDKKVLSLMGKIIVNLHESRTLKTLRYSLLPKLLSGEIRITNLQESAGERS
jgi:type I restriction enzyme, S subunit